MNSDNMSSYDIYKYSRDGDSKQLQEALKNDNNELYKDIHGNTALHIAAIMGIHYISTTINIINIIVIINIVIIRSL